ncbi:cation transporter, partial [Streptosporangium sp. NPDC052375]
MTEHADVRSGGKERSTAVLDVSGLQWASEQNVVTARLGRRPGVLEVEVNPVAQTATVVFDPARTSLAELRAWVIECGYHCAGQSVPSHICDPMDEPDPSATGHDEHHGAVQERGQAGTAVLPQRRRSGRDMPVGHAAHDAHVGPAAMDHAEHPGPGEVETLPSPHEMMGHGGMSMAAMVADMRNRFLVALLFSIPIVAWSPIGTEVLG